MSASKSAMVTAELLRRWRASAVPVEDAAVAAARRTRMVGEVAACIRNCSRRERGRQQRHRLIVGLSLAAAVCLGVGIWRGVAENGPVESTVGSMAATATDQSAARVVVKQGTVVATVDSRVRVVGSHPVGLSEGDEIITAPDGTARLELSGGARLELAGETRVRVKRTQLSGQRIVLGSGKLWVSVPEESPNQKLAIETPDAEVHVVGTVFSVELQELQGQSATTTLVNVEHGKVRVVRRRGGSTSILAGQRWSSAQDAAQPSEDRSEAIPARTRGLRPASSPKTASRSAPESTALSEAARSELAAQNRLFRAALGARNAGNYARALSLLGQFLARYPQSPLQQEAQVERFRVLKRMGSHAQAARQARRYLAEHESGFARDEARELVLEPAGKQDTRGAGKSE